MIAKYWKVHINNFEFFIDFLYNQYKFSNFDLYHFKSYYVYNYYLYLFIERINEYEEYTMTFIDYGREIIEDDTIEYMGEFNLRYEKLKKLNKLCG